MGLYQLVYVSRRTPELTESVLAEVIKQSAQNNRQRDITGVLMRCGDDLMQLLEGEQLAVEQLYAAIAADPRHTQVQCLLRKSVNHRVYPEWGMGLADPNSENPLDRPRLMQILDDVRSRIATAGHAVEARILINDFKLQFGRDAYRRERRNKAG